MKKTIYLLAALMIVTSSFAQKKRAIRIAKPTRLEIDLSSPPGIKHDITVRPGDYQVVIKNKLTSRTYTVKITKERNLPDALSFPAQPDEETQEELKEGDPCENLKALINVINEAKNESQLVESRARLEAEISRIEASNKKKRDKQEKDSGNIGTDNALRLCDELLAEAKSLLLSLDDEIPTSYNLRNDEKLTVVVSTVEENGQILTWEAGYSVERRVDFVVTYGYLAASAEWPYDETTYYLKKSPPPAPTNPPTTGAQTQTLYKVTKSNSDEYFYPVASIMFSYKPTNSNGASIRPVAGLGTNTTSVDFLFGAQLLIHSNIAISTGFIYSKEKVLNGQYTNGQDLSETLTDDQLHDERYVPKGFIGISLRFNENPRRND